MANEEAAKAAETSCLYEFKGKAPKVRELIPLSLQHVLAAVVGVVTPAMVVAQECQMSNADTTIMIQAALIMTAVATLLQLFPLFGKLGAGLPVIMGTSFAYVPTLRSIGGTFGFSAILGAQIIGGCVAILFGIFVKWIRKLFPDVVTGTVIFTIGLALYPTAITYMAGGSNSDNFGSASNWIVAIITFVTVFILNNYTKGILKQGSLFFGMVVGYIAAIPFGLVDFSKLAEETGVVSVPQVGHFEISFVPAACISLAVVYVVNSVQTIGDLTATTVGGLDRNPTDQELRGGIVTQGLMSILGSFVGALPTASYSQNVGIVTLNKVVNRVVFAVAAVVLLIAGFVPKISAFLTTIPQAVIGGATISVFAVIAMTGIRTFTTGGFDSRKSTIVGLSVALGVGVTSVEGSLAGPGMPAWIDTVFGSSSVVVTAIMAVVLNLILPKTSTGKVETEETAREAIEEMEEEMKTEDSVQ